MLERSEKQLPLTTNVLIVAIASIVLVACGARGYGLFGPGNGDGGDGGTGGQGGNEVIPPAKTERIDMLLVVDNSRSMADKQEILSLAVPRLLDSFINPVCVDTNGTPVTAQPATATDDCPSGERLFDPVSDIHIGVISTSLGGHGSDTCNDMASGENDAGHLNDQGPGGTVITYEDLGFLAWDPEGTKSPPGNSSATAMAGDLKALVLGVGQTGCGFEATHEAWYRFLVEPDPHAQIVLDEEIATLVGTDDALLQMRRDFLRPDSLLSIVVLSDENDCSVRQGSQYYFVAQALVPGTSAPYHLPKPRAACADDPNDSCCLSCGQPAGSGCDTSGDDCNTGPLPALNDHINVRCFDQKRRFGIDFLWPIDRYTSALSDEQITDRHGNVVDNPLFTDLNIDDDIDTVRDERLVLLTTLVGVPWQDIARQNEGGQPDLLTGLNDAGLPHGGFQNAAELSSNDTWSLILGDPSSYHTNPSALPDDPLMIESIDPRTGQHPITQEAVAPPGAGTGANTINGHEYSIPARSDLQYACIFELIAPRDCSVPNVSSCDCSDVTNDNPLCQNEFNQFGTTQYRAKAYPGIRHLQLLQSLDGRAVLGSICPAQLSSPSQLDFGYAAAVRALVEAAAPVLQK